MLSTKMDNVSESMIIGRSSCFFGLEEEETQNVVYKEGKGNVLEAMILGREIILVVLFGFGK